MDDYAYERKKLIHRLLQHLRSEPNLLQVITGPRQVGKTVAIHQIIQKWGKLSIYQTADQPIPPDAIWLQAKWEEARKECEKNGAVLFALDEIQKIPRWSEVVKKMFDEDRHRKLPLRVVILGSSALLVQKRLSESLSGRFELTPFPHWSYQECSECFQWGLDHYLFYGGYPGAAHLLPNETRWGEYIRDSLIETVLNKDIFLINPIEKPALFRQVFALACEHPAEIIAYQKMLGQLQEAGNTTTVASYLNLLKSAYLISPLQRWSGSRVRQRSSSPKIIVLNNGLINGLLYRQFQPTKSNASEWGRLIENAVGAHLLNLGYEVFYWRDRNREVDFVVKRGEKIIALEIKKGSVQDTDLKGIKLFLKQYPKAESIVVGDKGADLSLNDFFKLEQF